MVHVSARNPLTTGVARKLPRLYSGLLLPGPGHHHADGMPSWQLLSGWKRRCNIVSFRNLLERVGGAARVGVYDLHTGKVSLVTNKRESGREARKGREKRH